MVYQSYQDPTVNRYLKLGFWIKAHVQQLYKAGIGFGIGVCAVIWIIVFIQAGKLLIARSNDEVLFSELEKQRIPALTIHALHAPSGLVLGDAAAMASASEITATAGQARTADFVGFVENPNQNWSALVSYVFTWEGGQTLEQSRLVMPAEQTVLVTLGATVNGLPRAASLDVVSVSWSRVKSAAALGAAKTAQGSIMLADSEVSRSDGATSVLYTVESAGAYTIVDPSFIIVLIGLGNRPVGVARHSAGELTANEPLQFAQRWLHPLPGSLTVQLYPVADFLSADTYRSPRGSEIVF